MKTDDAQWRLRKRRFFDAPEEVYAAAERVPISEKEVERVTALLEAEGEGYDGDDLRLILRYVQDEPDSLDFIRRGGPHGYAVARHEAREIQHQIDNGIDIFNKDERFQKRAIVRVGHALGLLDEHDWLLVLAKSIPEFEAVTFGDLVLMNPAGDGEDDFTDIRQKTDRVLSTTSHGRGLAKAFFAKIILPVVQ